MLYVLWVFFCFCFSCTLSFTYVLLISCFSFVLVQHFVCFYFSVCVCFYFLLINYIFFSKYVRKLHISAFRVSGGFSYMKSRGLIAPLLVHNVYDACGFICKKKKNLMFFVYIDFYHTVLNLHTFYFQISFISEVAVIQMYFRSIKFLMLVLILFILSCLNL